MLKQIRKRYTAALILLVIMAVNFAAEGLSLYLAQTAWSVSSSHGMVCSAASVCTPVKASCCSKPKKKTSCGCPHCGDNCPMGDACTCGHDGKSTRRAEGMFFRVPGCHPAEQQHDSSYIPLSMRFTYLAVSVTLPVTPAVISMSAIPTGPDYTGPDSRPLVPPPKMSVAA